MKQECTLFTNSVPLCVDKYNIEFLNKKVVVRILYHIQFKFSRFKQKRLEHSSSSL